MPRQPGISPVGLGDEFTVSILALPDALAYALRYAAAHGQSVLLCIDPDNEQRVLAYTAEDNRLWGE